jgi:hypothetical protein
LRTGEITIDFSKAFGLDPYERLLTEIAATGVYLWVVVCIKEFLLGRSQRDRVDGNYLRNSK